MRRTSFLTAVAVVALWAVTCEGASIPLVYGYLRTTTATVLYVAKDNGFFEREGLNVTMKEFKGGTEVVVGTVSKSLSGGLVGAGPFLLGAIKKLPLVAVSDAGHMRKGKGDLYFALLAPNDSSIRSAADLRGKRVGVRTYGSTEDLLVRLAASRAGLRADQDFKMIEVPNPEQAPAMMRGDLDAALTGEPFVSRSLMDGKIRVILAGTDIVPAMQISVFTMGRWFIDQHPDAPARFNRAIVAAAEWVEKNEKEARQIMVKWTGLPAAAADRTVLPTWGPSVDLEHLRSLYEMMKNANFVTGEIDFSRLVYVP